MPSCTRSPGSEIYFLSTVLFDDELEMIFTSSQTPVDSERKPVDLSSPNEYNTSPTTPFSLPDHPIRRPDFHPNYGSLHGEPFPDSPRCHDGNLPQRRVSKIANSPGPQSERVV
jgi:hypothetical protein